MLLIDVGAGIFSHFLRIPPVLKNVFWKVCQLFLFLIITSELKLFAISIQSNWSSLFKVPILATNYGGKYE